MIQNVITGDLFSLICDRLCENIYAVRVMYVYVHDVRVKMNDW